MDQLGEMNIKAFSRWRKEFPFAAVPYTSGSNSRREFLERVRQAICSDLTYCDHVQVTITIYVDEYKQLERDDYADLDNYAKSILDSIKGADRGIIIDDSQVQWLAISWIDSSEEHFEVTVENPISGLVSHRNGLKLYEMPDRLYYPIPSLLLAPDGSILQETCTAATIMRNAVYEMVRNKCTMRHRLRQDGTDQRGAYQASLVVAPILSGLHKSRAIESGYPLIQMSAWRSGDRPIAPTPPQPNRIS